MAKKDDGDFQVVSLPKTRPAIGDMLHEGQQKHMIHGLTATIGHDLVDGAPAARFLKRLSELLENGFGLDG